MDTEKKTASEADVDLEAMADEALKLEAAAKSERDIGSYTHTFKKPFEYQGHTMTTLTFHWGTLTGADHLAIENELLMRGLTLLVPAHTSEFLIRMAVRSCTDRGENNFRVLDLGAMKAMPLRDFQAICKRARNFLLRAGS